MLLSCNRSVQSPAVPESRKATLDSMSDCCTPGRRGFPKSATMPQFIDRAGIRYGRLTAISPIRKITRGRPKVWWLCKCDCGNPTEVESGCLSNGNTASCGCLLSESTRKRFTKHGHSPAGKHSSEYSSWSQMKSRCAGSSEHNLRLYKNRGIKVCDRWLHSFENFLADMGKKPSPKHSIDRIDGSKGYEPSNCRWATTKQQANNTRTNLILEINGEKMTAAQAGEKFSMNSDCIIRRIRRGWSITAAITLRPDRKRQIKNTTGSPP